MSSWINFVKRFAKENNISYGDALKEAGPYYTNHSRKTINSGMGMRRKRKSSGSKRVIKVDNKTMKKVGKLLGGVMAGKQVPPKGLLASLLSGLNANVKIE